MASLTVGYSDSEDRVWVRLVGENAEQRVWLTRRRVMALIQTLASRLEATLADLSSILQIGSIQRLAMELNEAAESMNPEAPRPATGADGYQVMDGGLCTVFDLEVGKERWVVRLHTVSGQPLVFDGGRLQMHQLLKSLLNRQEEADWRLDKSVWVV